MLNKIEPTEECVNIDERIVKMENNDELIGAIKHQSDYPEIKSETQTQTMADVIDDSETILEATATDVVSRVVIILFKFF